MFLLSAVNGADVTGIVLLPSQSLFAALIYIDAKSA